MNKTNTFNARVILINNMMVHTYISLKSTPLKTGCTAPICWSEHFTCLFHKSYLKLLKIIFLSVGGLGPPGFSWLGCTAKFSKQTNKQFSRLWKRLFEFSKLCKRLLNGILKRSFFDRSEMKSKLSSDALFVVEKCFSKLVFDDIGDFPIMDGHS